MLSQELEVIKVFIIDGSVGGGGDERPEPTSDMPQDAHKPSLAEDARIVTNIPAFQVPLRHSRQHTPPPPSPHTHPPSRTLPAFPCWPAVRPLRRRQKTQTRQQINPETHKETKKRGASVGGLSPPQ